MRAVVQRAGRSFVEVNGKVVGKINSGLVVFVGISVNDEEDDCSYLADKICGLRIFEDSQGKMNLSIKETRGEILCISQFTLYGDCRKGRRPSFFEAAPPEKAVILYDKLCHMLREKDLQVETGRFQARMKVRVDNDGPVTILLDSQKNF
ncbi:MAG TPA: D-tyrosyl-tRNA(Tyr) deacylase [Firmicutes bacterium]|nr:D-tyrosyl-tRNA(Tyr) deacylase [Bacillota bacterium]